MKIDQEAHAVQFFCFKVGLLKYFETHFTSSQLPGVQTDSSQSMETQEHMNQPQLNAAEFQKQNNPRLKKILREQPGSAEAAAPQWKSSTKLITGFRFTSSFWVTFFFSSSDTKSSKTKLQPNASASVLYFFSLTNSLA